MTTALPPVAGRLLASLPAVYRQADRDAGHGDLRTLLAAFEAVLLGSTDPAEALGYEQQIGALPSLLSTEPMLGGFGDDTLAAFAPWIAAHWVAFAPFAQFDAARLRRIVGGIVPLYSRRGTPAYLQALLRLCFAEELDDDIGIREHLGGGFILGNSRIGIDTWIGAERPHVFELRLRLRPRDASWSDRAQSDLRTRLQAVIDFAKPAHTVCELRLQASS
jgi:hypothetical protein